MTAIRVLNLESLYAPTHVVRQVVTAWRIAAADELATHRRLTIIADGEPAHVEVPADFCRTGTPVTGDWLVLGVLGEVSHMRADVFEASALPVPRANAGCLSGQPRVPRFPG